MLLFASPERGRETRERDSRVALRIYSGSCLGLLQPVTRHPSFSLSLSLSVGLSVSLSLSSSPPGPFDTVHHLVRLSVHPQASDLSHPPKDRRSRFGLGAARIGRWAVGGGHNEQAAELQSKRLGWGDGGGSEQAAALQQKSLPAAVATSNQAARAAPCQGGGDGGREGAPRSLLGWLPSSRQCSRCCCASGQGSEGGLLGGGGRSSPRLAPARARRLQPSRCERRRASHPQQPSRRRGRRRAAPSQARLDAPLSPRSRQFFLGAIKPGELLRAGNHSTCGGRKSLLLICRPVGEQIRR